MFLSFAVSHLTIWIANYMKKKDGFTGSFGDKIPQSPLLWHLVRREHVTRQEADKAAEPDSVSVTTCCQKLPSEDTLGPKDIQGPPLTDSTTSHQLYPEKRALNTWACWRVSPRQLTSKPSPRASLIRKKVFAIRNQCYL